MQRVAHLAWMLVLAIALPLQGFAASTMSSCGLGQHDHADAHAATRDHHAVADSRGDAMPPAGGHAYLGDAGRHETGADHSHAGKTNLAKASLHKCSDCASCCVGAAVPSQPISFASVKQTDSYAPLGARRVPGYVTEGLERPPRAFLA